MTTLNLIEFFKTLEPMTTQEIEAQNKLVSEAAKATEIFTDDELEAHAKTLPAYKITYNDEQSHRRN